MTTVRAPSTKPFMKALEKSFSDGKVTEHEARDIQHAAAKVISAATDKRAAAVELSRTMASVDSALVVNHLLDGGPSPKEVFDAGASVVLKDIRAMLGGVIAEHAPASSEKLSAGALRQLRKDFAEMAGSVELLGPAGVMPFIDKQLAPFDSSGLTGPAKFKLDRQREAITAAVLAETRKLSADVDDRFRDVIVAEAFRAATGKYLSAEIAPRLQEETANLSKPELLEIAASLRKEALKGAGDVQTFATKNYAAAMGDGAAYFEKLAATR